jgi:hypothetical protein
MSFSKPSVLAMSYFKIECVEVGIMLKVSG